MTTRPLTRLLRDNPELGPIRDRLAEVKRLQGRYRSVVPEGLVSSSRVCSIEGTTVVVRADNAPVAAALRAMAPRLLAGLNAGYRRENSLKIKCVGELTALRIEVQVAAEPPKRPPRPREALPVERLAAVAEGLGASPLKDALERIVATQTKRRTRPKT